MINKKSLSKKAYVNSADFLFLTEQTNAKYVFLENQAELGEPSIYYLVVEGMKLYCDKVNRLDFANIQVIETHLK